MLTPEIKYVSETKYLKYQQNIEGNSSIRMWKCEKFKLARSARSHILHTFSQCKCFVGILSFIASYHKWYKESALIVFMYADVIWDLKINIYEREYLQYQQNDEGNNSFRLWKNFKLARSARSHIHRFLLILMSCHNNVVYIAPYHKQLMETALIV